MIHRLSSEKGLTDRADWTVAQPGRFQRTWPAPGVGCQPLFFFKTTNVIGELRPVEHRFVDITEDLVVLEFFAPAEGSLQRRVETR
jgi:hypothetical protein